MDNLTLTSPHTTGQMVKNAQNALNENKFGDFYDGSIDGDYGFETALAAREAKYWLGWRKSAINGTYGQNLHNLLKDKKRLPRLQLIRRKRRLKKQKKSMPLRVVAFNRAVSQDGIKENPANSNKVKFSQWYGMIGPWCAMFTTWAYVSAGADKTNFNPARARWAYVPYMVAHAKSGMYSLTRTNTPLKGDIVTFDWQGDGISDHCGLFDQWIDKGAGKFSTVEGNTSLGNNSNGGQVMRRERSTAQVQAFIRVNE